MVDKQRVLIFIPTYNEAENVRIIYEEIKALDVDADILFCDDNSPDGTGEIIDEICGRDERVFVTHRQGKFGIGNAHRQGIDWAYSHEYSLLVTMDCDFSHAPVYIKDFIQRSTEADVIVGSRYIRGDSLKGWNLGRRILTHVGHFLTHTVLKIPYDATGAFRCYKLEHISKTIFHLAQSNSYSFFFESLYILMLNKITIKEIPIHLPARTYGHSKMTLLAGVCSLGYLVGIYCTTLFYKHRLINENFSLQRQFVSSPQGYIKECQLNSAQVEQEWEQYWKKSRGSINIIYDAVACFYRFCIIKNALNHFIRKYFPAQARLLHAGCGSGQVDVDISKTYRIQALDIAASALRIYKVYNPHAYRLAWADIFRLPLQDNDIDGIYNLGVMEHFSEGEIQLILLEFKRVLKPGGMVVIFWPPVFGLATRFLRGAHYLLNHALRLQVKLHPVEVTQIKCKAHMVSIFEQAGFEIKEYYFGVRDLWTHSVMAAQKKL